MAIDLPVRSQWHLVEHDEPGGSQVRGKPIRKVLAQVVWCAFGAALGREVEPSYAPLEAVEPTFRDLGLAGFGPLYREMFETMNAGQLDFEFPNRIRRGEIGLEQAVANMLASSK